MIGDPGCINHYNNYNPPNSNKMSTIINVLIFLINKVSQQRKKNRLRTLNIKTSLIIDNRRNNRLAELY